MCFGGIICQKVHLDFTGKKITYLHSACKLLSKLAGGKIYTSVLFSWNSPRSLHLTTILSFVYWSLLKPIFDVHHRSCFELKNCSYTSKKVDKRQSESNNPRETHVIPNHLSGSEKLLWYFWPRVARISKKIVLTFIQSLFIFFNVSLSGILFFRTS